MAQGIIFDIKEFAAHDGPGIRNTVFFKGCPLRCMWCHNPEGLSFEPEIMKSITACMHCGKCNVRCSHEECRPFELCTKVCPNGAIRIVGEKVSSDELAERLKKHEDVMKNFNGGVTISGGEPLAQPEFLIDLLKKLKPVHTAVETSGYGKKDVFKQVIELADIILFDIKHMDPGIHKKITGVDNGIIMDNLKQLIDSGKKFIVRVPLIPTVNDTRENMEMLAKHLKDVRFMEKIELLPYNQLAGAKYPSVGREYRPQFDETKKVETHPDIFNAYGIKAEVRR